MFRLSVFKENRQSAKNAKEEFWTIPSHSLVFILGALGVSYVTTRMLQLMFSPVKLDHLLASGLGEPKGVKVRSVRDRRQEQFPNPVGFLESEQYFEIPMYSGIPDKTTRQDDGEALCR